MCSLPQQGWMFVEVSMPICSRASKELWPGSEGSLVTKNIFCSLKILAHVTVFKYISSVLITSKV